MDLELSDSHVVVAGSSKGLGLFIARAFRDEGAAVWLSGRSEALLAEEAAKLAARFTPCDLATGDGRARLVEDVRRSWARVDCLVLNLGSGQSEHRGLETPDAEWFRILNLNFVSHAALLRDFKPLLQESGRGSAISISSIAGEMRLPAPLGYGASKAALNHFCNATAAELAGFGIRFNAVSPGNVFWPGGRWDELQSENPEQVRTYIESAVPLKRFATPEEVAAVVVFLGSPRAAFCTGSLFRVDGGQVPSA
jgi:3-oxoacyl-[acyl-carrier protein] reductase